MSTAILYMYMYMYICCLITYKMLLDKDSTAETSWENKVKNSRLVSRLYSCTAIDRSEYLTIRRAHAESTHGTLSVRLQIASHSLVFVSWSFTCSGFVSNSLSARYVCVFEIFHILQFVERTSSPFVIAKRDLKYPMKMT